MQIGEMLMCSAQCERAWSNRVDVPERESDPHLVRRQKRKARAKKKAEEQKRVDAYRQRRRAQQFEAEVQARLTRLVGQSKVVKDRVWKRQRQLAKPYETSFYTTRAWLEIRYEAIRRNDGKCGACGRGKTDGIILHVDHIKPRSKFPKLELDVDNLQILCEQCNLGKGNRDATDWR